MDGAAHGEERPIERAAVERDAAVEPRDLLPELGEHRLLVATDVFEKAVRRGAARALGGPDESGLFRVGMLAEHGEVMGAAREEEHPLRLREHPEAKQAAFVWLA